MPVRHLLVWLAAGAACWSLIAAAAFFAPQALLALGVLVMLPWLRHPRTLVASGVGEPVPFRTPAVQPAEAGRTRDEARVLVAQSA
jgi:hypothetical protein